MKGTTTLATLSIFEHFGWQVGYQNSSNNYNRYTNCNHEDSYSYSYLQMPNVKIELLKARVHRKQGKEWQGRQAKDIKHCYPKGLFFPMSLLVEKIRKVKLDGISMGLKHRTIIIDSISLIYYAQYFFAGRLYGEFKRTWRSDLDSDNSKWTV